jgi:hypothetical protein
LLVWLNGTLEFEGKSSELPEIEDRAQQYFEDKAACKKRGRSYEPT